MAARPCARGEMLHEYLLALKATTASLQDDTEAVLAEARQAVAHARQGRRSRARVVDADTQIVSRAAPG